MKNYPTCWPGVKFEDLRQKKTLENKLNEPSPPKNKKNILITKNTTLKLKLQIKTKKKNIL